MLGQRDRLGVLHVGEPGHDGLAVGLRDADQGHHQIVGGARRMERGVAQVHAEVGSDLVVPAPGGVEPSPVGADHLGQGELDACVHVLPGAVELERFRLDLLQDRLQSFDDVVGVLGGDDPAGLQHPGVGQGPHDVVERHAGVGVQAAGEGQGGVVHPALEPAGPEGLLHAHLFLQPQDLARALVTVLPGSPQT